MASIRASGALPFSAENAGYVIVRNTGHLLHEEKYDKVLELIKEYIPVPID